VTGSARAFIGLLALSVLSPAAARAGGIAKVVQPQPDAPVQISTCSAGIAFSSNQWGTTRSQLNTAADFENVSTKTAVSVLIRFQLSNGFGDVMDNTFGQATGKFSANAPIVGNHWASTDEWPGLGEIRCSVSRVLFDDGSVWKDKEATTPSPSP